MDLGSQFSKMFARSSFLSSIEAAISCYISLDSSAEMYGNSMGILSPSLDCSRSTKVQAWTAECWSESEIDFC